MQFRRVPAAILLFCLISIGFTSCLVRRRSIARKGGQINQALLVADRPALIDAVAKQYEGIQDFNAEVNMVPALGTTEKNKVTEYKDVRAYILFRTPADIRIIGLYPVIRTKAFDMVSNGLDFKLYLPAQTRFITGKNEMETISKNKIENLRPQHFLEALMVSPVDPVKEKLFLENFTDEDNAYYIVHVVHPEGAELRLARTIWFNRLDLKLTRQLVFDGVGNILTDARYSDWKSYDNVPFPKHVEINRPHDEYGVVLDVVKMDINKGLSDDKFVLEQPEGTKLQILSEPNPP